MAASTSLTAVIGYAAVCAGALAAGGTIATRWPPSAAVRSYIQHVAAGLVFAAVGVEVLPDVLQRDVPFAVVIGFSAGVALMLAIRGISERFGGDDVGAAASWALLAVIAVDIFVDGLLVGVTAVTDRGRGQQALLVTVALAVELLSLGLSVAARMDRSGLARARALQAIYGLALSPLAGGVAGYALGHRLSSGWIEGVLALAAAALLYLAAEELLKDAHEVRETAWGTTSFFAAFLLLLLIAMMTAPAGG